MHAAKFLPARGEAIEKRLNKVRSAITLDLPVITATPKIKLSTSQERVETPEKLLNDFLSVK
jgi:hypothetical protein